MLKENNFYLARSFALIFLVLVFTLSSVLSLEIIQEVPEENYTDYRTSPFSFIRVQQIEVDQNIPGFFNSNTECINAHNEEIDWDSIGLTQEKVEESITTGDNSIIETIESATSTAQAVSAVASQALDKIELVINAVTSDLTYDELDELTSYGVPITDFRDGDNEVESYWSNFSEDFEYCPELVENGSVREGLIHLGMSSNVFNISVFNFGNCLNCIIDPLYGVGLDNNNSLPSSLGLLALYTFSVENRTIDSTGNLNDFVAPTSGITFPFESMNRSGGSALTSNKDNNVSTGFTVGLTTRNPSPGDATVNTVLVSIINSSSTVSTVNAILALQTGPSGSQNRFRAKIDTSTVPNTVTASIGDTSDKNWHTFIVVVNTTNSSITAFVDNANLNSSVIYSGAIDTNASALIIGALFQQDNVFFYNRTLSGTEVQDIMSMNLFYNKSDFSANYTGAIQSRTSGNFHRWINITYAYTNLTARDNISVAYRTGRLMRPNLSDPNLILYMQLNYNSSLGENNTYFVSTVGSFNSTCRPSGSLRCPGNDYGYFQGENASTFNGTGRQGLNITGSLKDTSLNASINFTVMAWVKAGVNNTGSPTLPWVISYGRDLTRAGAEGQGVPYWGGWGITATAPAGEVSTTRYGSRIFLVNGSAITLGEGAGSEVNNGEWHHVALIVNDTRVAFYIDGDDEGRSRLLDGQVVNITFVNSAAFSIDFCIGALGYSCGNYYPFNGTIDEVVYFNRSLNQSDLISWASWTSPNYNTRGISVSANESDLFIQARAFFRSNEGNNTPILTSITFESNYAPTQGTPTINASTVNNLTFDNITWFNISSLDNDNDTIKTLAGWCRDGSPFEVLVSPIDSRSNSSYTRDYSCNNLTSERYLSGELLYIGSSGYDGFGGYNSTGTNSGIRFNLNSSSDPGRYNNLSSNFTMMLRFKGSPNGTLGFYKLLSLHMENTSRILQIDTDSSFKVRCRLDTENVTNIACKAIGNISNTDWHFVALKYERGQSGDQGTLFVDNGTTNVSIIGNLWDTINGTIIIGGGFPGVIDDVRVYPYALPNETIYDIRDNRTNYIHSSFTTPLESWTAIVCPDDGNVTGSCTNTTIRINNETLAIHAISPTDGSTIGGQTANFTYNVSSDSNFGATWCRLNVGGIFSNATTFQNGTNSNYVDLSEDGTYDWTVTCNFTTYQTVSKRFRVTVSSAYSGGGGGGFPSTPSPNNNEESLEQAIAEIESAQVADETKDLSEDSVEQAIDILNRFSYLILLFLLVFASYYVYDSKKKNIILSRVLIVSLILLGVSYKLDILPGFMLNALENIGRMILPNSIHAKDIALISIVGTTFVSYFFYRSFFKKKKTFFK